MTTEINSRGCPRPKLIKTACFNSAEKTIASRCCCVTHKDQKLSSINYLQPYISSPAQPSMQTMFFTDRSLYRPGQTIHYKGICMSVNQNRTITKRFRGVKSPSSFRTSMAKRSNAWSIAPTITAASAAASPRHETA